MLCRALFLRSIFVVHKLLQLSHGFLQLLQDEHARHDVMAQPLAGEGAVARVLFLLRQLQLLKLALEVLVVLAQVVQARR